MNPTTKQYTLLRNKYNLPELEQLNNFFEILPIKEEDNILRTIVKKLLEILNNNIKLFSALIQPDTSIKEMYEYKEFNDEERQEISKTYKQLMLLKRSGERTLMSYDEKELCNYITLVFNNWQELSKKIHYTLTRLEEAWKKEDLKKDELGYFG